MHTVGVQCQYPGTAGRIENAQVAAYLNDAGATNIAAALRHHSWTQADHSDYSRSSNFADPLGGPPYDDIVKFTLEHIALRRTSENEPFPWLLKLVTLVRVARDGTVQQAKTDGEKRALLGAARNGDLVLAAWPGEWSQDIFVVDDLRAARIALGLPRNGTTEASTPTDPLATGRGPTETSRWSLGCGNGSPTGSATKATSVGT